MAPNAYDNNTSRWLDRHCRIASDIQLTADTGRPQLRSASERICVVPRAHNSFGDKSFCCRPSGVERLAITSAAGHELQTYQACTEMIMFRL